MATLKEQHKEKINDCLNKNSNANDFLEKSSDECSKITAQTSIDYLNWSLNRMGLIKDENNHVIDEQLKLFEIYLLEKNLL